MYYFPIVHSYGYSLSIEKNNLVVSSNEHDRKQTYPLEDIGLAVCLTQGVSVTSDAISILSTHNVPIIWTNEKYRPVSVSQPMHETIDKTAVESQINLSEAFQSNLWSSIKTLKISNQEKVLELITGKPHLLDSEESTAARQYWERYFQAINHGNRTRRNDVNDGVNGALNYGYVVVTSMIHRFIVAYGLIPSIGLHHAIGQSKFPLAYDLVEPFRPFVDYTLYEYLEDDPELTETKQWKKEISDSFFNVYQDREGNRYEMRHLIRHFCRSVKRSIQNEDDQIKRFDWYAKE